MGPPEIQITPFQVPTPKHHPLPKVDYLAVSRGRGNMVIQEPRRRAIISGSSLGLLGSVLIARGYDMILSLIRVCERMRVNENEVDAKDKESKKMGK